MSLLCLLLTGVHTHTHAHDSHWVGFTKFRGSGTWAKEDTSRFRP